MKIYTKTGDAGQTGLWGGERVPKDHLRVKACGGIDELNAALGMALASQANHGSDLLVRVIRIQSELFQLGAELATPRGVSLSVKPVGESEIKSLEREIDSMEVLLAPLKNFILPGGAHMAACLHFARSVSRRAERDLISLNRAEPLRPEVLQYLNRLSDYLFVCARLANHEANVSETPWRP